MLQAIWVAGEILRQVRNVWWGALRRKCSVLSSHCRDRHSLDFEFGRHLENMCFRCRFTPADYAINLFISWELMPIDYGKIRVLNMTKSAKKRAENLGVSVLGNPRVLITRRLSLAQSSSEESPLQIL